MLVRGRVSLYEQRGDYQFIADYMEEAGEGALRQRFELLKVKLAAEGCSPSTSDRCRACRAGSASSPRRPALRSATSCTSCAGASARFLCCSTPSRYSGVAPHADREDDPARVGPGGATYFILVRGGGSLEDLWAFNEGVARAIYDCAVPSSPASAARSTSRSRISWPTCARRRPSGAAELVVRTPASGSEMSCASPTG